MDFNTLKLKVNQNNHMTVFNNESVSLKYSTNGGNPQDMYFSCTMPCYYTACHKLYFHITAARQKRLDFTMVWV